MTLSNLCGAQRWDPAKRPAQPQPSDYRDDPNLLPVRLYSPVKLRETGLEPRARGGAKSGALYAAAVNNNPGLLQPVGQSYGMRPTTTSGQTAFRVDPARGSILVGDACAQSTYHSRQLSVEKRFTRHFQFGGNYTWSSFMNESDDILGGQANRTLPSAPFNLRLDKGRSGYDQPHRIVLNGIYLFPTFFNNKGVWGRIVDGWQLSGIWMMAKGTPFSILNANNPRGILPGQISTIDLSQRGGFNPGGLEKTGTSAPVSNPMWIAYPNNSALIGAGANIRRVGTTYTADLALVENARTFGESQSLQLRWEVFHAFNHRNFTTNPANTVSTSTNNTLFLNLGQANAGGRSMWVSARYIFYLLTARRAD